MVFGKSLVSTLNKDSAFQESVLLEAVDADFAAQSYLKMSTLEQQCSMLP